MPANLENSAVATMTAAMKLKEEIIVKDERRTHVKDLVTTNCMILLSGYKMVLKCMKAYNP